MKSFLTIGLMVIGCLSIKAQKVVMIEFASDTNGNVDLVIRNILADNGYRAFVNYGRSNAEYDFVLKYETSLHPMSYQLQKYKLRLLDKSGGTISMIEKSIPSINFGVNESREICKGLSALFKTEFDFKDNTKEIRSPGISFIVHKLDSSTYSIVAKGVGARSLSAVEEAFLKKGSQYLKGFEYYFENRKYDYSGTGGYMVTSHSGFVVVGIIKSGLIQGEVTRMNNKPDEFDREFIK